MGLAAMFCYDLGIDSERRSKGEIESGRNTQTTDIPLPVTGSGPLRAAVQAREAHSGRGICASAKVWVGLPSLTDPSLGVSLISLLCRMEVILIGW